MADRPDLAAMMAPLIRALLAMETPILAEHDISMWGYSVLSRLTDGPVRGQAVLAEAIGADKTRLIDVLDELQERGLIRREPDPTDRRARVVAITAAGSQLRDRVRRAIQHAEQPLLRRLPPEDRVAFLRGLHRLADHVRGGQSG
ncbi:MarR family winged helix-turn-helix transcriptional regulator [Jatrophihabitans sp. DSM 44399]|uniref:MarR family winged helix-turn-helix transcriptional regulator n=1 Tax=Jatrophihabitans lederbergiae TaxID=3075547 RepID=A0ABU2JHQ6_9ACTN|nr:MarR family winged helix-turn-helix transcriptional regulator [Jatrophihabitans sp. DSM 44399]MDT0264234.1 MarR family winged helix-turn-helix transcriptional regulator [Jatrophihabitans sp. DSM 44399]